MLALLIYTGEAIYHIFQEIIDDKKIDNEERTSIAFLMDKKLVLRLFKTHGDYNQALKQCTITREQ